MTTENVELSIFVTIFDELKKTRLTAGIDKISKQNFENNRESYLRYIVDHINSSTYTFNPYRERLILKKRSKYPRVLSLPTIKDKIVLKYIKNTLDDKLSITNSSDIMNFLCADIPQELLKSKYNYYFTLDIEDFYGNVNHEIIIRQLQSDLIDDKIIDLINKAITTPTIPDGTSKTERTKYVPLQGLPQGISISNGLANYYLKNFDNQNSRARSFKVFRYVDDLLILCNDDNFMRVYKKLEKRLKELTLSTNDCKHHHGYVTFEEGVEFLGYRFYPNGSISLSSQNKIKFKNSIEKIFNDYKNAKNPIVKNNTALLQWSLDNKIGGIFINGRQYGWMYYYKHSRDLEFCYNLDHYITKLLVRFNITELLNTNNKYIGKKFVPTYYFMKDHSTLSPYTRQCDKYTRKEKKELLVKVARYNITEDMDNEYIDYMFNQFIFKSIRELEFDLSNRYL